MLVNAVKSTSPISRHIICLKFTHQTSYSRVINTLVFLIRQLEEHTYDTSIMQLQWDKPGAKETKN